VIVLFIVTERKNDEGSALDNEEEEEEEENKQTNKQTGS
jgi:hypothetical protein